MRLAGLLLALILVFSGNASVREGREGVISHMGPGYPDSYLALPIGPGHRVRLCGPRACVIATSTDAGPNRAMLEAGRIADVSEALFRTLCCDPSRGTFVGSWRLAPFVALPETSTVVPNRKERADVVL
jgi:hypothetical protein